MGSQTLDACKKYFTATNIYRFFLAVLIFIGAVSVLTYGFMWVFYTFLLKLVKLPLFAEFIRLIGYLTVLFSALIGY